MFTRHWDKDKWTGKIKDELKLKLLDTRLRLM